MSKSQINEELMKQVLERIDKLDDKVERKFDNVENRLDSMDKTLVKQEENLKEHMRRTELAERSIEKMDTDLKPIKKHVDMLQGVFKFIGLIATVVGIIAGLAKLFSGS